MSQLSINMQLNMLYFNCVPFNTLKEELGLKGNKTFLEVKFRELGYLSVQRFGWLHKSDIPAHLLGEIKKQKSLNLKK